MAAETSTPPTKTSEMTETTKTTKRNFSTIFGSLFYTPPWLKWDPDTPYELSWPLNLLFATFAAFEAANLYYTHPILHVLSEFFDVSEERASLAPTLVQAGYAAGLLLICPVGDLLPRRPLVITLTLFTAIVWLGCTLTHSFEAFIGLHFLVGMFTVTPQLMFPLVVRYAPAQHRPTMLAVIMSGLNFGILLARLISGIVAEFTSWRVVFWVSFGLQMALLVVVFFCMPDFPALRPGGSYPGTLLKIVTIPFKEPVLVQQALTAFLIMGMFTSFWTTLTFQLNSRFHLSTLVIGLFALVGMAPIVITPLFSRLIMTRIHSSGTLVMIHIFLIAVMCVGTFVGNFNIAGTVIWAIFGDFGMSIVVVSTRMAFAGVEPSSQNTVNAVYMVFTFCGQLFGTAVGNKLYAQGGWIRSGAFSIGVIGAGLLVVLLRGPHEKGWIGWRGGWEVRNSKIKEREAEASERARNDDEAAKRARDDEEAAAAGSNEESKEK